VFAASTLKAETAHSFKTLHTYKKKTRNSSQVDSDSNTDRSVNRKYVTVRPHLFFIYVVIVPCTFIRISHLFLSIYSLLSFSQFFYRCTVLLFNFFFSFLNSLTFITNLSFHQTSPYWKFIRHKRLHVPYTKTY